LARGFRLPIRYCEIWNEPENRPAMRTGTLVLLEDSPVDAGNSFRGDAGGRGEFLLEGR
jgi:hypothetical protein